MSFGYCFDPLLVSKYNGIGVNGRREMRKCIQHIPVTLLLWKKHGKIGKGKLFNLIFCSIHGGVN